MTGETEYRLYFENRLGRRREITSFSCGVEQAVKRALSEIHAFCDERDFKIYYSRVWNHGDSETVFDVGSHTEFFYLVPAAVVSVD